MHEFQSKKVGATPSPPHYTPRFKIMLRLLSVQHCEREIPATLCPGTIKMSILSNLTIPMFTEFDPTQCITQCTVKERTFLHTFYADNILQFHSVTACK